MKKQKTNVDEQVFSENKSLTEIEKKVLNVIQKLQREDGAESKIFYQEDTIAVFSNYSHAVVYQALKKLCEYEIIEFMQSTTYPGDFLWRIKKSVTKI
jgi:Fe2+ or Zn2+ uptake regulation protein